jgi:hypothetical protein
MRFSPFREINERIRTIAASEYTQFLCECPRHRLYRGDRDSAEYERIRLVPTRFIVRPGHVIHDVERVVEREAGYVVVEKFGAAGSAAVAADPRRRSEPTHS